MAVIIVHQKGRLGLCTSTLKVSAQDDFVITHLSLGCNNFMAASQDGRLCSDSVQCKAHESGFETSQNIPRFQSPTLLGLLIVELIHGIIALIDLFSRF